jgi:2-iminobutanoate/2-iminopropanoate deaminase
MKEIQVVHSDQAPKAVGPYSQAMVHDGLLYTSGQIGLDPAAGVLVGEGVELQTRQVTKNLSAVLDAAGVSVSDIIKVNIYLTDMDDFPLVNAIYANWLAEHRPARATVAVAALPLAARVEMDLIARVA